MKNLKKLTFLSLLLFLFLFIPKVFGQWARFVFNISSFNTTLDVLKSDNTDFTVSFDSRFNDQRSVPYKITPFPICNEYNDNGDCIDQPPNLCPYISVQPKNEENTEIGFNQNPYEFIATGELDNPADINDNWNLSITSPCFEGECPADYDSSKNGQPLPQSLKGKTFQCSLYVESNEQVFPSFNSLNQNTAYALMQVPQDTITISAVLTGKTTVVGNSSVLFLPGIEASRLYRQKTVLGIDVEDQLWEPNSNSDVEDLYLKPDGTSINPDIYTRDIIKETNVPTSGSVGVNIYKSFATTMDQLVAEQKITEWQSFAYDWRQDINDSANVGNPYPEGVRRLKDAVTVLAHNSKSKKVTIVAHSTGGLVAKALLKQLQDDKIAGKNDLIDKVDVLVLIAVPEIGTAKAVPALLHGYDQQILGGWLMNEFHARELGRNMLGAYGLLPSKEYINRVSASPVVFEDTVIPSGIMTQFIQNYGNVIDSYPEYKDFLFGNEGRIEPNPKDILSPIKLFPTLFQKTEDLHDSIDSFVPPSSMRVIEIAGWGIDTVATMKYYPKYVCNSDSNINGFGCKFTLDEEPIFTANGDKTVVEPSAHFMGVGGNAEKYWVNLKLNNAGLKKNRDHKDILEVEDLNNFLSNLIKDKSITLNSIINNIEPMDESNRLRISIHSPVTLDAYDTAGNHTGKVCPSTSDFCYIEENISNSSYLEFGEGKYINLPEDGMSKIKLQGIDVGTFTYKSEKVLPNGTSNVSSFVDIPVTTQTQAEITLNSNTNIPQLALDVTGDGITDFTLAPNDKFDPIAYLQIMKTTIDSLDIPQSKKNAFDKRVDNIIKSIQKGKIDKAKLKTERFQSVLEKKLSKPDPKHPKPKKLTKTDAQLLLDMLNKLLDNLS